MQAIQEGQCSALLSACQMSRAPAMKLSGSISSKGWEERSHISQEMAWTCTEARPIIQGMRLNSSAQPRPNPKKPGSFTGVFGFKKDHHSSWAPCVCLFPCDRGRTGYHSSLAGVTPAFHSITIPALSPSIVLLASLTSPVFPCSGSSWALTHMLRFTRIQDDIKLSSIFPVSCIPLISMGGLLITLRFFGVLVQALQRHWPHPESQLQRHLLCWPHCLPHTPTSLVLLQQKHPLPFLASASMWLKEETFDLVLISWFRTRHTVLFLGLLKRWFFFFFDLVFESEKIKPQCYWKAH